MTWGSIWLLSSVCQNKCSPVGMVHACDVYCALCAIQGCSGAIPSNSNLTNIQRREAAADETCTPIATAGAALVLVGSTIIIANSTFSSISGAVGGPAVR